MGDYRVNLDMFAGPLDLLLYLVRKEEVDIYDIPIAKVTEQYIHYVEMLKSFDIDLAGDFLVMAATLMEIKSAMLLPKVSPEQLQADDIIDPRAELVRQLLEYKKFKDAANLLEATVVRHRERFGRPDNIVDKLKPNTEQEFDMDQVSIWDLLDAFDSIMKATSGLTDISHIKDDTPIDLYQIEILHRLQSEGPMSFERIFEEKANRLAMVGLFLALLELIRDGLTWVEQAESTGAIFLRSLTDEPAEQAVQRAILAAAEEFAEEESDDESPEQQEVPIPIAELPPESEPAEQADADQQDQVPIPITELPSESKPAAQADTDLNDQTPIPIAELPAKTRQQAPVKDHEHS